VRHRVMANPSQNSPKAFGWSLRRKTDYIVRIPRGHLLFIELTRCDPTKLRGNDRRSVLVASDDPER
jgi:hypothetical protein